MIKEGDLGYALQASSAVPALRKPVEIDGKLFVDGGVACNFASQSNVESLALILSLP
jgi:NTE family protein